MKKLRRNRKRGMTMIEVVVGASISVLTLVGGVGCFMAGMMSWMKGVGAMDSISKSQDSVRMICQQLREAMSVTINTDGTMVTYSIPSKDQSGSYLLPLASDGITRKFVLTNGILSQVTGDSSRVVTTNVMTTDPASNSAYRVFSSNNGDVTRQVVVTLITSKQGFRDNWTPSRSRESVYLRNVPQLSR
jgi:type II secretory pathway pseudopilin PulG